jgi:hypothetical protein
MHYKIEETIIKKNELIEKFHRIKLWIIVIYDMFIRAENLTIEQSDERYKKLFNLNS